MGSSPSFLVVAPGCSGFGVHVVTLGICPPQFDQADDGDNCDSYAVDDETTHHNPNPERYTKLNCFRNFAVFAVNALVSFYKYQDP